MTFGAMMCLAMLVDVMFGWQNWLYRRVGHPVTWIGALIRRLDQRFNREIDSGRTRRMMGVLAASLVIGLTAGIALAAQLLLPQGLPRIIVGGILAWPFVAVRSMYDHVAAVARALKSGDLTASRFAVSMIVGRDTSVLDTAGVTRAAMESLAENTSDGIVAPLFWGVLFGLPGIAAYKAINTLDSMIGHRTARYNYFGWASAKVDDLVNLIPARMTGLLFALVSPRPKMALRVMLRDAGLHRSPNAGWPEAALAGGLGIRLSGPRKYADRMADEPWVNTGTPDPTLWDLQRSLALYRRAMFLLAAGLAILAIA